MTSSAADGTVPRIPDGAETPEKPHALAKESAPPPGRGGRLLPPLLRATAFRHYWAGQTISRLGEQISSLAIPLIGVTVVHADAAQMGYLGAATWLPNLLFALHAGLWADRRAHRRRVMIVADLGRFALLTTIPIAYVFDALTLVHLYVVAFLAGTFSVLFEVCNPPVFKALVPPGRYVEGNALTSGSRAMSKMLGPSLGGILVQLLSAPVALFADALSYLASAFCLSRISPAEAAPEPRAAGQLKTAVTFIARSGVIRAALAATATVNFFTGMVSTLFVLYSSTALHIRPGVLGVVLGAGACGALLGAACATPLARRVGVGRTFLLGCVLLPAPLLLIPAATGPAPVVLGMLLLAEFLSGLGVMWLDVALATILTTSVPDALRSRVFGAYQAVSLGTRPVASLLAGAVATVFGLRPTLWIAVAGGLTAFLWLLPSPVLSLRQPDGDGAAGEGTVGEGAAGEGAAGEAGAGAAGAEVPPGAEVPAGPEVPPGAEVPQEVPPAVPVPPGPGS